MLVYVNLDHHNFILFTGSGSLSPMTGQPRPVGYSPTQQSPQGDTPVSQGSSDAGEGSL